ncbi:hypothetical protein [Vibrio agarivorans]|uniref:hypothetical protein n=1 Tax=Vibrio agarivorans TaxID=153622 RepID=UPI0025B36555|nr:hypothetical protein [Vibrio agarivorans]MDN3661047.1 hypothetical protein [Vibrio agarivorans]
MQIQVKDSHLTLLQLVSSLDFPKEASCVMQVCDGRLIWFTAPLAEVLVGLANDALFKSTQLLHHSERYMYSSPKKKGLPLRANDWSYSVVTKGQHSIMRQSPMHRCA